MTVKNANLHNLQNVTVNIPTGVFTVITGVAGRQEHADQRRLPQAAPRRSCDRSIASPPTAARASTTHTGIMDDIRKAFAKANDVSVTVQLQFARKLPQLQRAGVVYTDLAFMEGIASTCEICEGKRFKPEVLEYHLRGQTISDVLDMTAEEALAFFTEKKVKAVLRTMWG
ncbi:MAG: hypothetical protein R2856_27475 [Caldilineaceae bacterium]